LFYRICNDTEYAYLSFWLRRAHVWFSHLPCPKAAAGAHGALQDVEPNKLHATKRESFRLAMPLQFFWCGHAAVISLKNSNNVLVNQWQTPLLSTLMAICKGAMQTLEDTCRAGHFGKSLGAQGLKGRSR
jgi:hypothetical protein